MLKKLLLGLLIVLAVAAIFFGISYNQMSNEIETYAPIKEGVEERIVFFDIGEGDREFLSQLIDSIQQCKPKVLAIDVLFQDLKDARKDSLLMNSLSSSNVVLATRHDGKQTYAVHPSFLSLVNSYGYAQSIQRGRFTSDAFYLSQAGSNHFAYEIVKRYDPLSAQSFREEKRAQPLSIVFTRLEKQFKVYKFKDFDFNCNEIRDKIAYMGYFGNNDDLHVTKSRYHSESDVLDHLDGEPDMHGSVVVANQVLMILDNMK